MSGQIAREIRIQLRLFEPSDSSEATNVLAPSNNSRERRKAGQKPAFLLCALEIAVAGPAVSTRPRIHAGSGEHAQTEGRIVVGHLHQGVREHHSISRPAIVFDRARPDAIDLFAMACSEAH